MKQALDDAARARFVGVTAWHAGIAGEIGGVGKERSPFFASFSRHCVRGICAFLRHDH